MKEVVLIAPNIVSLKDSVQEDTSGENLGLGHLASFLRQKDVTVEVINNLLSRYTIGELVNIVKNLKPQIIGISCTFNQAVPRALNIAKNLKDEMPSSLHITLGGHAATFLWKEILLRSSAIDSIVRGEGELTLYKLVSALQEGCKLDQVKGIAYRNEDGDIKTTPPRSLISNLDTLPWPSRGQVPKILQQYGDLTRLNMSTSRGCYANCSFCSVNAFYSLGTGEVRHKWRAALLITWLVK